MIEGDAIGGDEDTGAILSKTAMNKNLFVGASCERRKRIARLARCWEWTSH